MLVKTNENCFIAGARRRAGAIFELPKGLKLAKYMEKVREAEVKAEPKAEIPGPRTFSEITATDAKALDLKLKGKPGPAA